MKTVEEMAARVYQPIGMSCNEFAVQLAKEYAKQLLEEYTNRIIENATVKTQCYNFGDMDEYHTVDKESITNQLELFKQEIGI
jgi:hypothetical protein